MNEFHLINEFLKPTLYEREDVELGIGDDAALLKVPEDKRLVLSMDSLVSGVHFPENVAGNDLADKALMVNLSDLAAMGATPAWVTMALHLPCYDEAWMKAFSQQFHKRLSEYQLQLVGGDISRGPLSITLQVHGFLPLNKALLRSGAQVGDDIYVSGQLGLAKLALDHVLDEGAKEPLLHDAFYRPKPQLALGQSLLDYANSCIDISDGLLADLSHILEASAVGAKLHYESIPVHPLLMSKMEDAREYALTHGEDYQLCFTVPKASQAIMLKHVQEKCITPIGTITKAPGLVIEDKDGKDISFNHRGYRHF